MIKISDCSVRDGGYLGDKNFSPEFIRGVLEGLEKAGIDFIETGFLQDNVTGETLVYANSKDVIKYLPEKTKATEFVGFCDNSRYSNENLDECDGSSFTSLRISFAKHEWREALQFCSNAKAKGYKVFVQPMDAKGYTDEEREELIEEVNKIKPYAFAIVDTFGAMHLDDLYKIFSQVDKLLDKDICVGLHTHNNLNLANALAEQLILMAMKSERTVAVDGSLLGMARGAGNASTEALAAFINSRYAEKYDIPVLLNTIEKYIVPLKERVEWGYDIPMFICGDASSHVDNIGYLKKKDSMDYADMYTVINELDPSLRKRYGKGYSKSDFTALERVYLYLKDNEVIK